MKNEAAHLFETFITTYETTATETNQKTRILRCSFQNGTNHKSHSSNSFVDKFDFTPLKWQWYLTDKTISWHYLAGRIRPCGEICPLCHLHFARSWTSSYLHKVVIILTVLRNGNLRHFKAVNKIKLEMYVQLLRTLVFQTEHKSLFFFSLTHTRTYTLIRASRTLKLFLILYKKDRKAFSPPDDTSKPTGSSQSQTVWARYHLLTSMTYSHPHIC